VSKSRTEAFSDGVFAVAATLLVFSMATPIVRSGLSTALLDEWPSYAAYVISFMTIVVIWVNHHVVVDAMDRLDRPFLFLNALLLLTVAVIPFPTGVLAHYLQAGHDQQIAAFAYGLTMSAMAFAFSFFSLYARRLVRTHMPFDWLGFSTGLILFPLATLLALVSFNLSLAIYACVTLFYLVLPIVRERVTRSRN
jgi:uncharacterized membrane protein